MLRKTQSDRDRVQARYDDTCTTHVRHMYDTCTLDTVCESVRHIDSACTIDSVCESVRHMYNTRFGALVFLCELSILNLVNLEKHFTSAYVKIRIRAVMQSVLPVDAAVPCFKLKTYVQEQDRSSAQRFFA